MDIIPSTSTATKAKPTITNTLNSHPFEHHFEYSHSAKMKTFIAATIISLLSASALSAPVARDEPAATIALSNDMNGAYATVTIPFGQTVHLVPDLFAGTAIDIFHDGSSFLASSSMLVGGLQYKPICAIQSNDGGLQAQRIEGQLTAEKTYLKFGEKTPEGLSRLEVVELRGAFIQCNVFN